MRWHEGRVRPFPRMCAALALAIVFVLTLFAIDLRVDARASMPEPAAEAPSPSPPGRPRVFVLLLDSLRWESATDPRLMPRLVALQSKGTRAKVRTTRDAVTVPALRAAFSGRDRVSLFGFVRNLWHGSAHIESIFSQAVAARGARMAFFSDGHFLQFGERIAEHRPHAVSTSGGRAPQIAAVRGALAAYAAGTYDLVVSHVGFTDTIAHQGGVSTRAYADAYRDADALVAEADAVVPPDETLIVMGDHGHDEAGRHALGLDVPTFLLYRGAAFRAVDLGTVSITDHRYLLSWALHLPLAPSYLGGRHPQALSGEVPPSFAARASEVAMAEGLGRDDLAFLFAMAIAIGAAAFAWTAWLVPEARRAVIAFAFGASSMALAAYGLALFRWRPRLHEPSFGALAAIWGFVLAAALLLARRFRAERVAFALSALVLLLGFPTVYRYGAVLAVAPLWVTWLIARIVTVREGRGQAACALVFLAPFLLGDAVDFSFRRFVTFPSDEVAWMVLSLVAKLVVLVRPRRGALDAGVAFAAALFLFALEWRRSLVSADAQTLAIVGAITLVSAGIALSITTPRAAISDRSARLALFALLLATQALLRVSPVLHAWGDAFLAATVLSSASLAESTDAVAMREGRLLLVVFGVLGVGFGAIAWTIDRLEWAFLYDLFDAAFVERRVGLFILPIVARFALPVLAVRVAVAERLGAQVEEPRRAAILFVGVKVLAATALILGMARASIASDVYLEAVQQTAIFLCLSLGVLFGDAFIDAVQRRARTSATTEARAATPP